MNLPRLTYEQSKRAIAVGFDWPTNWYFDRLTAIPLPAENFYGDIDGCEPNPENAHFLMWCREVHNLHGWVAESLEHPTYFPLTTHMDKWPIGALVYVKYEEAETALIDYLLDLLENKTK